MNRAKLYFEWGYNWCCWAVGIVVEEKEVHIMLGPLLLHWDWL